MGTYKKVEQAKAYKQIIHGWVEKYLEEKEDIVINSGQLKFFKGLMIRHLAISTNIRIRAPRKRIFEYLDATILKKNDEVIAFFDPQENRKKFLESPYCMDFPCSADFKMQFSEIPFLLLQKAQSEVEHALDDFFYVKEEKEKEAFYLDLLLSLALYEIFLREIFENHITPMMSVLSPVREPAEMERINCDYEEVQNCTDLQKRKELISELWEQTSEYFEKLCEISYAIYCMGYFAIHQSNFYALLRIIVLIEFVNVNTGMESDNWKRMQFVEDANFWMNQVGKFIKKDTLFGFTNPNRNLTSLYKQLNLIYKEKELFPRIRDKETYTDFEERTYPEFMALIKYIELVKNHAVELREPEQEREVWKLANRISMPIWNAVESIANLQQDAEKLKRKG